MSIQTFSRLVELWLQYLAALEATATDSATQRKYKRQRGELVDVQHAAAASARIVRLLQQLYDAATNTGTSSVDRGRVGDWTSTCSSDEAAERVSRSTRLFLIHGPPGTGKTRAIARIVVNRMSGEGRSRVLVASESHAAVVNALTTVVATLRRPDIRVVRYAGPPSPGGETTRQVSQGYETITTRDPELMVEMAAKADVLGASCNHAARFPLQFDVPPWDVAIVDEVSKATPPEILIPAMRCRSLVLVGDPHQLPPVFLREEIEVAEGLSIAGLLERNDLIERLYHAAGVEAKAFLGTQYRMVDEIGSMVSSCFYQGKVKNGRKVSIPDSLQWLDYRSARRFPSRPAQSGNSLTNSMEALIIQDKLEELRYSLPADTRVAVITPYRAQKALLRDLLATSPFHLEIDTVDAFQGRQAPVVFFSFTRNTGPRRFFSDTRRLNVALSRAEDYLFLVGDSKYLAQTEKLRAILSRCTLVDRSPHSFGVSAQLRQRELTAWSDALGWEQNAALVARWIERVLMAGPTAIAVEVGTLARSGRGMWNALSRISGLVRAARKGYGSITLDRDSLVFLWQHLTTTDARRWIVECLGLGPVDWAVDFEDLLVAWPKPYEAVECLAELLAAARRGGGRIQVGSGLPMQLRRAVGTDDRSAVIQRLLRAGPMLLELDADHLRDLCNSWDECLRCVASLADAAAEGTGVVSLARGSLPRLLGPHFTSASFAVVRDAVATGALELTCSLDDLRGDAGISDDIVVERMRGVVEGTSVGQRQRATQEANALRLAIDGRMQNGTLWPDSSAPRVRSAEYLANLLMGRTLQKLNRSAPIRLSTGTLNQLVTHCGSIGLACDRLGSILSSGAVDVEVSLSFLASRCEYPSEAVQLLSQLAEAAYVGGSTLRLEPECMSLLCKRTASVEEAMRWLRDIVAPGSVRLTVSLSSIQQHSDSAATAIDRVTSLAAAIHDERTRRFEDQVALPWRDAVAKNVHLQPAGAPGLFALTSERIAAFAERHTGGIVLTPESLPRLLDVAPSVGAGVAILEELLATGCVTLPVDCMSLRQRMPNQTEAADACARIAASSLRWTKHLKARAGELLADAARSHT